MELVYRKTSRLRPSDVNLCITMLKVCNRARLMPGDQMATWIRLSPKNRNISSFACCRVIRWPLHRCTDWHGLGITHRGALVVIGVAREFVNSETLSRDQRCLACERRAVCRLPRIAKLDAIYWLTILVVHVRCGKMFGIGETRCVASCLLEQWEAWKTSIEWTRW